MPLVGKGAEFFDCVPGGSTADLASAKRGKMCNFGYTRSTDQLCIQISYLNTNTQIGCLHECSDIEVNR